MWKSKKVCPHCGRKQPFRDTICPYCGFDLTETPEEYRCIQEVAASQRSRIQKNFSQEEEESFSHTPRERTTQWTNSKRRRAAVESRGSFGTGLVAIACMLLLPMLGFGNTGTMVPQSDYTPGQSTVVQEEFVPIPEEVLAEYAQELAADSDQDWLLPEAFWRQPEQWAAEYPDMDERQGRKMHWAAQKVKEGKSQEDVLDYLDMQGVFPKDAQEILVMLKIDWNDQALRAADMHLQKGGYSRSLLYGLLERDKFTEEQIEYAIQNVHVDWGQQLDQAVRELLELQPYSESQLREDLSLLQFSEEDIGRYLGACDIDFSQQALRQLEILTEDQELSREDAMEQLIGKGYSPEQAVKAAATLQP